MAETKAAASSKGSNNNGGLRALPAKEAAMLKAVLQFHEQKQYRKGLKQCEQILKKFPEHGETLALKGLLLHCIERKEEGYAIVDRASKNDPSSYTVWHVQGLMYRADRKYPEALRSYAEALKFDPENVQIIRDSSLLQMQTRDYEKYASSRHKLLRLRPTNGGYWIGAIVANYITKNYKRSLDLIASLRGNSKSFETLGIKRYELSELIMFQAVVLEDSGDLEGALKVLDADKKDIVDILGMNEAKARIFLKQKEFGKAAAQYMTLIRQNADCKEYINGYIAAKQIDLPTGTIETSDANQKKLLTLLQGLKEEYPRSHYINLLILKNTPLEEFESVIKTYLQNQFRKGVPSNFVVVRKLSDSSKKMEIVEKLVLGFETNLKKCNKFLESHFEKESPSAILWVYIFLARYFDHKKDFQSAMKYIDLALQHTPTMIELYMFKARIFKHQGNTHEAAQTMDKARLMDLQDRYVNTKAVKYLLRNGEIDKARRTILLFSRPESTDPVGELVEMQTIQYTYELAAAYYRARNYGEALKYLDQVNKHFEDFYEDQLDFHSYSMRKVTVRSYLQLLNFEDGVFGLSYYKKAAKMAINLSLHLVAHPEDIKLSEKKKETIEEDENDENSESEKRKAERKARKAALQKGDSGPVTSKPANGDDADDNEDNEPKKNEIKKTGDYYLQLNHADEAAKYLKNLTYTRDGSAENPEIHALAIQVYSAKRQYALALATLLKSRSAFPTNPLVHVEAAKMYMTIVNDTALVGPLKMLATRQMDKVWGGHDKSVLIADNEKFISENKGSKDHQSAYEEVKKILA